MAEFREYYRRRYAAEVGRTFEEAVHKCFTDPLDDEDIAAITRIWGNSMLRAADEATAVSFPC